MIWTDGVRQTASCGNVPPSCRPRLSVADRPSVRPVRTPSPQDLHYFIIVLSIGGAPPRLDSTLRPISSANRNYIFPRRTSSRRAAAARPTFKCSSNGTAVLREPRTIKLLAMIDACRQPPDRLYFATGEYRVSSNI